MIKSPAPIFSAVLIGLSLAGCQTMTHDVDAQVSQTEKKIVSTQASMAARSITLAEPTVQRSRGSWLGMKSTPLQADDTLPQVFHEPYAYRFPGKANISTIAERITKVIGIPVSVKPDVFLPISQFAAGGGASASAASPAAAPAAIGGAGGIGGAPLAPSSIPIPVINTAFSGGGLSSVQTQNAPTEFEMNYEGTLDGYLNLLSAKAGISWEYREGVISLHRLVTSVFTLKANPGSQSLTTSLGKTGNTQSNGSGGSTGFTATSASASDTSFSVWASLDKQIGQMLSAAGKRSYSEATSTFVVTDTKDIVDEVGRLIDRANSSLTRQVALRVEVLSIKLNDANEYGLDWNVLARQLSGNFSFNITSPTSLVSQAAGTTGFAVLSPLAGTTGSETSRKFAGSQSLLSALAEHGKVSIVTTANPVTLNRKLVSLAITDTTSFLAEVTPAPSGGAGEGSGTPGLKLGSVTTGFTMNLLPTVYDSNSIMLSMTLGLSDLNKITKVSSGVGLNAQSIEAPDTSESNFAPSVAMRPGETLVISGYDRLFKQYNRRTLGESVPVGAGGSYTGKTSHETLLILITPVLLDTAI